MEKKMILCDSNIVFKYFREELSVLQELDFLGFERLVVSSVTIAEMYFGMKKSEIRATKELVNKFTHYHIDKQISRKFLELLFEYRNAISLPDAMIASTALVYDVELYTFNKKDFDFIEGIQFYKPQTFGYSHLH